MPVCEGSLYTREKEKRFLANSGRSRDAERERKESQSPQLCLMSDIGSARGDGALIEALPSPRGDSH